MSGEIEGTGERTVAGTGDEQQSTAVGTGTGRQSTAVETGGKTGWVKCPVCGETVTEQGRGTHFRNNHPDLSYDEYKDRFEPAPPPPKAVSKETGKTGLEEKGSVYKEEADPNEILRRILEKHPDISQKHVEEIMDWAQFGPIPPYLVTQLLASMKDVKRHTAELIGHKYQMALQMTQGERPSFPPMVGMPPQQQGGLNAPWPWPVPQPPQPVYPVQHPIYQQPVAPPPPVAPQHPQNSGHENPTRSVTREDLEKIVERQREEFQRALEERERKRAEEEEKETLMRTLDGVRRALDNLNARVSAIERGEGSRKQAGEGDESFSKRIMEAAAKDIADRITGAKGELTPEKIRHIVSEEVRRHASPPPTGKRNRYDMEVEKAVHEAEARKIEAEERRRGFEAIAAGIREGLSGLGWSIGSGIAGGPPKEQGSAPSSPPPEPQPQPMEWRDGLWHTKCPYCLAPMAFEDGKSTVACPECHRIIRVQTTEEELKQREARKPKKSKAPRKGKPSEKSGGGKGAKGAEKAQGAAG